MTSTSQIFALGLIKAFVYESKTDRGVDSEVRLVSIPLDAPRPTSDEMFEKEYMNQLRVLGRAMGTDPESWGTELPDPYALDRD